MRGDASPATGGASVITAEARQSASPAARHQHKSRRHACRALAVSQVAIQREQRALPPSAGPVYVMRSRSPSAACLLVHLLPPPPHPEETRRCAAIVSCCVRVERMPRPTLPRAPSLAKAMASGLRVINRANQRQSEGGEKVMSGAGRVMAIWTSAKSKSKYRYGQGQRGETILRIY